MISEHGEVAIRVSDLRKSYNGNKAVDGVSFEIPKGVVFSLIGPNGAGKTTTISILEGILKRDSGKIEILGLDPWVDHDSLKIKIGVLPQGFNFFEKLTPLQAVGFYASLFDSPLDPEEILRMVSLESTTNTRFESLSGGQRQKVGLALALISDPEVLFLDEPTTGLDPVSRRAIWEVIDRFRHKGRTIVLTTHYMEEAERLSDIVAVIKQGRLISLGTPTELESSNSAERKINLKADRTMVDYLRERDIDVVYKDGIIQMALNRGVSLSEIVAIIENSGLKYSRFSISGDDLEDVYLRLIGNSEEVESL